jgi:hypothetical protein
MEKELWIVRRGIPHGDPKENQEIVELDDANYALCRSIMALAERIDALTIETRKGK